MEGHQQQSLIFKAVAQESNYFNIRAIAATKCWVVSPINFTNWRWWPIVFIVMPLLTANMKNIHPAVERFAAINTNKQLFYWSWTECFQCNQMATVEKCSASPIISPHYTRARTTVLSRSCKYRKKCNLVRQSTNLS